MADELRGAKIRLEWASTHLDAMRHESILFMTEPPQPYTFERHIDAECGCEVMRAKVERLPPLRLAMVVADAVHNLRSVLDMIAWECALKGDKPPVETDRSVAFPICMRSDDWKTRSVQRMIQKLPDWAVERVEFFQPFNRPQGIPGLGLVQSLDNWAKHKSLLNLFSFHATRLTAPAGYEFLEGRLDAAFNDNDVVGHIAPIEGFSGDHKYKGSFTAFVGFAKGPPGEGYPLSNLSAVYDRICDEVMPSFEPFFV